MDNNVEYLELVNLARAGDRKSMSRLAELAEVRVLAYLYRLTLDHDLARDLLQETMLEMVKSLWKLKKANRFWYWLFQTALRKTQHHYRTKRRKTMVQMSALGDGDFFKADDADTNDGLNSLVRKELSDTIFRAMQKLKLRHRNVLSLRCFEQMPFSEIAVMMNASELQMRVLFFRAKHSLKKQLSRSGYGKDLLLTAVGLFGLITTPTKLSTAATAASTVTAASFEVGFIATAVGTATTGIGFVATALLSALTIYAMLRAFVILAIIFGVILFVLLMLCLSTVSVE